VITISQEEIIKQQVEAFNKLFITYRKSYISQNSDGSYNNTSKASYNFKLTDDIVKSHLKLDKTIGIFSNPYSSKFVCFDLDMGDSVESVRRKAINNIIQSLSDIGISRDYIHIVFSGSKGYHLYIFFDYIVYNIIIFNFYTYILFENKLNTNILELRPLPNLGLKIPLGIHRKAKKLSYFVDENFNEIQDPLYITKIKQFPHWMFLKIANDLDIEEKYLKEYQSNLKYKQMSPEKMSMLPTSYMIDIETNGLQNKSTRNLCSTQLALYYNSQGISEEDALQRLNDWISAQDTQFYNSSLEFCFKENKKIIAWAYKNGIRIKNDAVNTKNVTIYKSEFKRLENISDINARKVLFVLMIHGKIYSKDNPSTFYMTYNEICKQSVIKNRNSISNALKHLEDNNEIKITKMNIDKNKVLNMYELKLGSKGKMYSIDICDDKIYADYYVTLNNLNHSTK
jgi:hypothetical protein